MKNVPGPQVSDDLSLSEEEEVDQPSSGSYVVIVNKNNKFSYQVKLVNNNRGVKDSNGKAVKEEDLKRSEVRNQTN